MATCLPVSTSLNLFPSRHDMKAHPLPSIESAAPEAGGCRYSAAVALPALDRAGRRRTRGEGAEKRRIAKRGRETEGERRTLKPMPGSLWLCRFLAH